MLNSLLNDANAPIAVIPARGGSKRIPRKNIREFLGKPIIAYPIEAAIDSGIFSSVIVSTDDLEIAETARCYGASVPFFRSEENSSDSAPIVDVILEVLSKLPENECIVCCMFPTSVFVTPDFLKQSFVTFKQSGFDSSACITEYEHPIQRALSFKANSKGESIEFRWPENSLRMTNSLEKYYHDVGLLYWLHSESLKKDKNIFTSRTQGIVVDRSFCQDIDCEADWSLAEIKYQKIFGKSYGGISSGPAQK